MPHYRLAEEVTVKQGELAFLTAKYKHETA
jgi:hypothetical protein